LSSAIDLAASPGLGRLLESQLFRVGPADPVTFAGVVAVFWLVALAACLVPARRASRMDPTTALHYE